MEVNSIPTKRPRARPTLLAAVVLALIVMVVVFQPELISTYWHLRFGNSTMFHGWTIPVPKGWWALTRDDQLIIQKMDRFYERDEPEEIIVTMLLPPRPLKLDALKNAAIREHFKKGSALQEDRPIRLGGETGYCLHFSPGKGEKQVWITCDSLDAHLSLDFFGRDSDFETFYSVIERTTKGQTPPAN